MAKIFTVEEANALLPQVRGLMEKILAARQDALAKRPDLWPVLETAAGNGGSKKAGELLAVFTRFEKAVLELQEMGCQLKGVEQGLVDFPAEMHGRQVYLCWKYNEPEILFWHDIDAGFAGRQRL